MLLVSSPVPPLPHGSAIGTGEAVPADDELPPPPPRRPPPHQHPGHVGHAGHGGHGRPQNIYRRPQPTVRYVLYLNGSLVIQRFHLVSSNNKPNKFFLNYC
jgi:hypothetical protein